MAITAPTPIPAAPAVPKSSDPEATFDAQYEAFNAWEHDQLQPGMNALAANVYGNAQDAQVSAASAAASAASAQSLTNFKGLWSSLTGALNMPATSLYANAYWVLTRNVADVTAEVPGVSTAWSPAIMDARPMANGYDLNNLIATGRYSVVGPVNGPAMTGTTFNAVIAVTRFGSEAIQEFIATNTRRVWRRRISGIGGTVAYGTWQLMSEDNPTSVAMTANTGVIDASLGVYFSVAISANTTLSVTNLPSNAYSFVLEIYHTGGTITLPANAVWVGGAAPTLTTPRRHLFHFQASASGSGGWIVAALPNSAA